MHVPRHIMHVSVRWTTHWCGGVMFGESWVSHMRIWTYHVSHDCMYQITYQLTYQTYQIMYQIHISLCTEELWGVYHTISCQFGGWRIELVSDISGVRYISYSIPCSYQVCDSRRAYLTQYRHVSCAAWGGDAYRAHIICIWTYQICGIVCDCSGWYKLVRLRYKDKIRAKKTSKFFLWDIYDITWYEKTDTCIMCITRITWRDLDMYDTYLVCSGTLLILLWYFTDTLRYGVQEKKMIRTGKEARPPRPVLAAERDKNAPPA